VGEGVTIRADGDPTSANWLQFGLGITTDFNRNSTIRIGAAYTDRNFKGTGAEWRTDVRVGTNLLFETGLYREWGRTFAEITPYWTRNDTALYIDNQAAIEVRDARLGVRLDGGTLIGNWGEFRLGINVAAVDLDVIVGSPLVGDFQGQQDVSWRAQFTADKLDSMDFPTSGIYAQVSYTDHTSLFGGDLDYNGFTAKVHKPISWGSNTILLGGEIGITSDGNGRSLADFRLGGFLNLSGLDTDQLLGRHKIFGRAVFYHRLSEVAPIVNLPLYIGGSVEVGNTWQALDDVSLGNLRPAGSLFVGADTPLGPVFFAGGLTRGNGALYLILGRVF
jgi:NTE family protein